ncbi:MAG: hypothetical protein H6993_08340 [Pseudomonadales bacterium]|nr:hypothetical protein [Pseudomonadales bacterium]MCP5183958.1 hypothetical protein [Pseudomonadales bacterium]
MQPSWTRWARWLIVLSLLAVLWVPVRTAFEAVRRVNDFPVHQHHLLLPPRSTPAVNDLPSLLANQPTDALGVPVHDYGEPLGTQYNPLFIADFALELTRTTDQPEVRRRLRASLDHLLNSATPTPAEALLFPYTFDFPVRNQRAPWYSAMAQVRVAQAMLAGWQRVGDERYLAAARAAALALVDPSVSPPLAVPVRNGYWLKEFPGHPYHVLDGTLVALAGLHRLLGELPADVPDQDAFESLFSKSVSGFAANAGCFTTPFGGVYFSDAAEAPTQGYYDIIATRLAYLASAVPALSAIDARFSLRNRSQGERVAIIWWQRLQRWRYKHGLLAPCVT